MQYKAGLEWLMTGDPMSAQRAYEIGLVNRVVPQGQGLAAALELSGPMHFVDEKPPGYNPVDVLERGQFAKLGQHHPLAVTGFDLAPTGLVSAHALVAPQLHPGRPRQQIGRPPRASRRCAASPTPAGSR